MDVLSDADGSAQAVRDAADAASDSRLTLERELDRLNAALAAHAQSFAQYLNWTLLAQAFLLTSFFVVLVGGWQTTLPGKRWLLAAIAGYGAISLFLGYLAQRGARDRLAPLRSSRRLVEHALERVAHRPAVFSRERLVVVVVGEWASRLMPLVILSGWAALLVYTLALPLPVEVRAAGEARNEARSSAPSTATAPRAKAAPRKAEEPAAATSDATNGADADSPLAGLLRRALSAPPAEPAQTDSIKP